MLHLFQKVTGKAVVKTFFKERRVGITERGVFFVLQNTISPLEDSIILTKYKNAQS